MVIKFIKSICDDVIKSQHELLYMSKKGYNYGIQQEFIKIFAEIKS